MQTEANKVDEWDGLEEKEEVSIEKMQDMVDTYVCLQSAYDDAHKISKDAWADVEAQKVRLLSYLEATGQKKFHAVGLGTVSRVTKMSVRVPKDIESKKQLFDWLGTKGDDFYLESVSVHHAKLNSIYNTENEIAAEEGKVFSMPGIGEPSAMTSIRFTKERK